MNLGPNNVKAQYTMKGQVLQVTDAEKDIGDNIETKYLLEV